MRAEGEHINSYFLLADLQIKHANQIDLCKNNILFLFLCYLKTNELIEEKL